MACFEVFLFGNLGGCGFGEEYTAFVNHLSTWKVCFQSFFLMELRVRFTDFQSDRYIFFVLLRTFFSSPTFAPLLPHFCPSFLPLLLFLFISFFFFTGQESHYLYHGVCGREFGMKKFLATVGFFFLLSGDNFFFSFFFFFHFFFFIGDPAV